jgi:hypothetical protein
MLAMIMVVRGVKMGQDENSEDTKAKTHDGNGEQSEIGEAK